MFLASRGICQKQGARRILVQTDVLVTKMFGQYLSISPPKPQYEVADVFRLFLEDYREKYKTTYRQEEVIWAILACRTPGMGGVVNQCEACGAVQFVFRSCGDSHCPKCGKYRKAEWVVRQKKLELPIPYFHVTFTTDHALNELVAANQQVMLDAIFWAVSKTLQEFGQKKWGVQLGITATLHTWGQTMIPHVHIHCIVTGGGLSQDGQRFERSGEKYLFDVVALSARYRERLCRKIKRLYRAGKVKLEGRAAELDVEPLVKEMREKKWEMFIKGFEQVEKLYEYLSRYVHQVAISNQRIVAIDRREKSVTFVYKDNKDGGQEKEMRLAGTEFIRRFLWHVLPRGFRRIRHYGLHHSGCRRKLSRARALLGQETELPEPEELSLREWLEALLGEDILNKCPHCGQQTMVKRGMYDSFNFLQLLLVNLAILATPKRVSVTAG